MKNIVPSPYSLVDQWYWYYLHELKWLQMREWLKCIESYKYFILMQMIIHLSSCALEAPANDTSTRQLLQLASSTLAIVY